MKEIQTKMSEVEAFDEVAALKWQIMRMEGLMAASLNKTGFAIIKVARRLQQLVESQQAHCLKFLKINFTFVRHTPHKTHYCS